VGAAVSAYQAAQQSMDGQQRAVAATGGDLGGVEDLGRWAR
jgi:hypothetical protein